VAVPPLHRHRDLHLTFTNSNDPNSPVARERNQNGLRHIASQTPPSADEARIDRIKVKLSGTVRCAGAEALNSYFRHMDSSDPLGEPTLFTQLGRGGTRVAGVRKDTWTVLGGRVRYFINGVSNVGIAVELDLNPTRTLQHAISLHTFDELAGLTPREFFRRSTRVRTSTEAATLTHTDNALIGPRNLGGTVFSARTARWTEFLRIYENQLRALIAEALLPPELGFPVGQVSGTGQVENGDVSVDLRWCNLVVSQAEVYWERWAPDASNIARRFADRAMCASSDATTRLYPTREQVGSHRSVDRKNEQYAIVIRQTEEVDFAAYAKLSERVRFEMRYQRDLTKPLGGRPPSDDGAVMNAWMTALVLDATNRLPWTDILTQLPNVESGDRIAATVGLADAIRAACEGMGRLDLFADLLDHLLRHGGASEGAGGPFAEPGVFSALARRDVVTKVRLQGRRRIGTPVRWSLTPRYHPAGPEIA
jgi:hypothetical protein